MKNLTPHTTDQHGVQLFSKEQVEALLEELRQQTAPSNASWAVVYEEIAAGGEWLGAARTWMQSNIHNGGTLTWDSGTPVQVPFYKLEELARKAAFAAVLHERTRVNNIIKKFL